MGSFPKRSPGKNELRLDGVPRCSAEPSNELAQREPPPPPPLGGQTEPPQVSPP